MRARPFRSGALAGLALLALAALIGFVHLAIELRALRARHATGPSWSFPSRVYSDGVALTPQRPLPETYLRAQIEARGYREVATAGAPGEYVAVPGGFEILLRGFAAARDPEGTGGPERVRLRIAGGRLVAVSAWAAPPVRRPPTPPARPGSSPWPSRSSPGAAGSPACTGSPSRPTRPNSTPTRAAGASPSSAPPTAAPTTATNSPGA